MLWEPLSTCSRRLSAMGRSDKRETPDPVALRKPESRSSSLRTRSTPRRTARIGSSRPSAPRSGGGAPPAGPCAPPACRGPRRLRDGEPVVDAPGVFPSKGDRADAFFVTLRKTERHCSPTTLYQYYSRSRRSYKCVIAAGQRRPPGPAPDGEVGVAVGILTELGRSRACGRMLSRLVA